MADDALLKKPFVGKVAAAPTLWGGVGFTMGEGLTPQRISTILRMADAGMVQPFHDLLNDIRQKDGAVQSLMQTRVRALMACGWSVVPAATGAKKGSPEWREAEEQAAFVRVALKRVSVQSGELNYGFGRALLHLLDGIYKGFSVCETDWAVIDGSVQPARIRTLGGRRFGWDEDMRLCLVDKDGRGNAQYPGDALSNYAHKFLVHIPCVNGDEPIREGLGRLIVWYACFRRWSWRDWMLFAELYGKPWREFVFDRALADQEDVDLCTTLALMGASSSAVAHSNAIECKIEWPESKGGAQSSPSPAILQRAEDDLAIAIVGQKATTGSVSGGLGGSGDVRDLVRKDILAADEQELCETVVRQLFAPMIWAKYGSLDFLPGFSFSTSESPDLSAFLDALTKAVKLGARIPVSYLHDQAGIPAAEGDEPILMLAAPELPTPPDGKEGEKDEAKEPPAKDAA